MLKSVLDACFIAKRVTEKMMPLPSGMRPRHIHVVDIIYQAASHGHDCRVHDVSATMKITTPSVTKLIHELEALGVVIKKNDPTDRRSTLLELTELGYVYEQKYVWAYQTMWAERLSDVSDADAAVAISVIEQLYRAIPEEEPAEAGPFFQKKHG